MTTTGIPPQSRAPFFLFCFCQLPVRTGSWIGGNKEKEKEEIKKKWNLHSQIKERPRWKLSFDGTPPRLVLFPQNDPEDDRHDDDPQNELEGHCSRSFAGLELGTWRGWGWVNWWAFGLFLALPPWWGGDWGSNVSDVPWLDLALTSSSFLQITQSPATTSTS